MHVETWVYFHRAGLYCLYQKKKKEKRQDSFCRGEVCSHQRGNGSYTTNQHQQTKFHLYWVHWRDKAQSTGASLQAGLVFSMSPCSAEMAKESGKGIPLLGWTSPCRGSTVVEELPCKRASPQDFFLQTRESQPYSLEHPTCLGSHQTANKGREWISCDC